MTHPLLDNPEYEFWVMVILYCAIGVLVIVGGWISQAFERRRIRRIFNPKN